jgi:hypothetical protein
MKKEARQFVFEKKNQKTFAHRRTWSSSNWGVLSCYCGGSDVGGWRKPGGGDI